MPKRILIVTSGHLASTPRMVKAADASHEAGYDVRVVCAEHVDWCIAAGADIRAKSGWRCETLDWSRNSAPIKFHTSRIRQRAVVAATRAIPSRLRTMRLLAVRACRVAPELVAAATREPCDLIYAGTAGGIAVGYLAAKRLRSPLALDLEDFHSGEQDDTPHGQAQNWLMEQIEQRVLRSAAFLTAGSAPMALAYREKYAVNVMPINNVFSLPATAPTFAREPGPLRMVWLSQTVGAGRGIEDAVKAVGRSEAPAVLDLRGMRVPGYVEQLQLLGRTVAPRLEIRHFPPDSQRTPVDICRGYDVGLALEQTSPPNRDLCLCNKPFTYMLSGLAIAASNTSGQCFLGSELGAGAVMYEPGDADILSQAIRRWASDAELLRQAKESNWQAARRRWHWDHPLEKGRLLEAVARVIGEA